MKGINQMTKRCFCVGGPNCCIKQQQAASQIPFKCPDCGAWWSGEHFCSPPLPNITKIIVGGHCHGCGSAWCTNPDDVPCYFHKNGYTITWNTSTDNLEYF